MATKKTTSPTLITAFNWVYAQIEQRDLTPSQQLALFHIIGKLNQNFWRPTPISLNKLAANMSQDKRTVKKSLETLKELKLIIDTKAGYILGINSNNNEGLDDEIVEPDNPRTNPASAETSASAQSADRAFKYFNANQP